jgi:hypothetical protein
VYIKRFASGKLTSPLTSILPVVSWAEGPEVAAFGCLAGLVDLPTPPTGPEGSGRATSDRRPPRPRVLVWRRVFRMSSRLVSSLEDMLIVCVGGRRSEFSVT